MAALENKSLGILRNVVLIVGLVLLIAGASPMAAALVVANQVIDDGPDLEDDAILQEWEKWGFSPRFVLYAWSGLGLLATGSLGYFIQQRESLARSKSHPAGST